MNAALRSFEDQPGWPPMPRRFASFESEVYVDAGLQLGLKVSQFGVDAQNTTNVLFGSAHKTNLMILKHTPTMQEPIFNHIGSDTFLHAPPGSEVVAICFYSSYLTTKASNLAQLTVTGTGVVSNGVLQETTTVTQSSLFYKVESGQTVKDWLAKCEEIYTNELEASIREDLRAASVSLRLQAKPDQCIMPSADTDRLLPGGKAGDASCDGFLNGLLPAITAHYTARCLSSSSLPDGLGFCQVRSPVGQPCPLYKDTEKGSIHGEPGNGRERADSQSFAYRCDAGLQCTMTQEAGWFQNWEIYQGYEAECR